MKNWQKILLLLWNAALALVSFAGNAAAVPKMVKTIIAFLPIWLWFVFLITSMLISVYLLLRRNRFVRKFFIRDKRKRIAILLPLNHSDDFIREDAELQLQGFGKALSEIRSELQNFDLNFLDHQSNPAIAKELIERELKCGTQYFICTMSSVCIKISNEFTQLSKNYSDGKAILICTVAGADEIITVRNSIYRFYINLKDEIDILLQNIESSKNKAAIIYFNASPYANFCANLFQTNWNNRNGVDKIEDDLKIELKVQKKSQIKEKLGVYKNSLKDREVIFIVAYGNAYIEILEALKSINVDALIVMTSTFSFKKWETYMTSLLNNFEWLSCKPALKQNEEFRNDVDVVTYFSMHTLEKFIQVISASEKSIDNFDYEWNKNTTPNKLRYSAISGKQGDYRIELTKKVK